MTNRHAPTAVPEMNLTTSTRGEGEIGKFKLVLAHRTHSIPNNT